MLSGYNNNWICLTQVIYHKGLYTTIFIVIAVSQSAL